MTRSCIPTAACGGAALLRPALVSLFLISIVPAYASTPESDPSTRKLSAISWLKDSSYLADPAVRRGGLWEKLSYIPLGDDPAYYLSIGGEVRYHYTYFDESSLGVGGNENGALQQRLRLNADFHLGPDLRVFTELGDSREFFEKSPTRPNRDRLDLQQGFVDASFSVGGSRLTLRPGRFQMPLGDGVLLGMRDGVNVRFAYDGLRAMYRTPGGTSVDLFIVRPVAVKDGSDFDDSPDHSAHLRGVYVSTPLEVMDGSRIDVFAYDSTRANARYLDVTADETRYSMGFRLFGKSGAYDYDGQLVRQTGDVGSKKIDAWGWLSTAGYTFAEARYAPRIGVKANIFSGDRASTPGRIETFVAPYPRTPLYTDAGWFAMMNQSSLHADVSWKFTPKWSLNVGATQLWRASRGDAIYFGPTSAPLAPSAGGGKDVGLLYNLTSSYDVNRFLNVQLFYTYVDPGTALVSAGGGASNFVGLWGRLIF